MLLVSVLGKCACPGWAQRNASPGQKGSVAASGRAYGSAARTAFRASGKGVLPTAGIFEKGFPGWQCLGGVYTGGGRGVIPGREPAPVWPSSRGKPAGTGSNQGAVARLKSQGHHSHPVSWQDGSETFPAPWKPLHAQPRNLEQWSIRHLSPLLPALCSRGTWLPLAFITAAFVSRRACRSELSPGPPPQGCRKGGPCTVLLPLPFSSWHEPRA